MATITITAQDVERADAFLEAYLKAKIPDADFSPGSANRDFTVKAIAYIFAYLESERNQARARQSLKNLTALTPDEDVGEAIEALLSNWFLTKKGGTRARLPVVLHFSRATDVTLKPTQRFFKSSSLIFQPNITEQMVIPASDLQRSVDADGTIQDYSITVTLLAKEAGSTYNVKAGRFVAADPFNPYFLYAENLVEGYDGQDAETAQELLERAPTAITVRNMVNERSIATVLRERYSDLRRVVTVGFGDPEMLRDRAVEAVTNLDMHVGGYKDIFVDLNRTDVTETLTIGGEFRRPDNLITILRDETIDFTGVVQPRDILRVVQGLPRVPRMYVVQSVLPNQLEVVSRQPFSDATDEQGTIEQPVFVRYSVGATAPGFQDHVPLRYTGQTSRVYKNTGSVVLTGRPHYRIKRIEVLNDDDTVNAVLSTRVNMGPGPTQYSVSVYNPPAAQSSSVMTVINVNAAYNGRRLRVTYETLSGFSEIDTFVQDRYERVLDSNVMLRALHPVYLSILLNCRPLVEIDKADVARRLAAYINTLDPSKTVDVMEIGRYVRSTFPELGAVLDPLGVSYSLLAPDGQVYSFTTRDIVTIRPEYPTNHAKLTNGGSLRIAIPYASLDPAIPANTTKVSTAEKTLRRQLDALGVSDRTIRLMTDTSLITINAG
jgi:hypothetical protein